MKYLVVSATAMEIAPLIKELGLAVPKEGVLQFRNDIAVLVTGVGMMQAAFHLGRELENHTFDHALQAGIAGSFDRELSLTEVVEVISQRYGDLGFPGENGFNDIFDMELRSPDEAPYTGGKLSRPDHPLDVHIGLKKVAGVSVNSVSSSKRTIEAIVSKYRPDVEVMEGIAFHYACLQKDVPYSEVRAISNYVEVRQKSNWKITEAITALNNYLVSWLRS